MLMSFYPVLLVRDIAHCAQFYTEALGFQYSYESDWYVSLKKQGSQGLFQLALMSYDHPTVPEGSRTPSRGIILNLEVENADVLYADLISKQKHPLHSELKDEAWGQRHFITADPEGTLIDVIQLIEPSPEFLEKYSEGSQ